MISLIFPKVPQSSQNGILRVPRFQGLKLEAMNPKNTSACILTPNVTYIDTCTCFFKGILIGTKIPLYTNILNKQFHVSR